MSKLADRNHCICLFPSSGKNNFQCSKSSQDFVPPRSCAKSLTKNAKPAMVSQPRPFSIFDHQGTWAYKTSWHQLRIDRKTFKPRNFNAIFLPATTLVSKDTEFWGASFSLYENFVRGCPPTQTPTQRLQIYSQVEKFWSSLTILISFFTFFISPVPF